MQWLYHIVSAITFRIHGGLRIPHTDKKFPINKWWFAVWFACLACILKGWSWKYWITVFIAARMSTWIAGWGEARGCAEGIGKPNPNRTDFLDFDEFCDNFHIGSWKLVDHAIVFGIVWLTLRGLLLSYLIGSALNSPLYMICGFPMGIIEYLCGLFMRKVLKRQDKTGWNIAEYIYGFYFSVCLYYLG